MGRSGYDTTGLGAFVWSKPRPAGGSKAGGGGQKGGMSAVVVGQEWTGQTLQSHTGAGSASAPAKNRGGGAAPPKK
ncbi:hypothetical protein LX36DRAFT_656802 [Colletotrichum falcatum]|nr:hypothetical protein LX36DRAFT_656802 [Colletotrichum falcatum]